MMAPAQSVSRFPWNLFPTIVFGSLGALFTIVGIWASGVIFTRVEIWQPLTLRLAFAFVLITVAGLLFCRSALLSRQRKWRSVAFTVGAGIALLAVGSLLHPGAIPL